jgi:hypothetical protein
VPALFAVLALANAVLAQDSLPARQGEVTGRDVYVRSGPSANHYPVAKLQAGDRVTIVSENAEWYELSPPAGVYSLISGDFVDTADGRSGVVNGDNVRIRAASLLPEYAKMRYVIQAQLSRGAEVSILDREPDGFLRILPPSGASVWVSRLYVDVVPGKVVAAEQEVARPALPVTESSAAGRVTEPASVTTPSGPSGTGESSTPRSFPGDSPFSGLSPTPARRALDAVEHRIREELSRSFHERDLSPLIERLEAIAATPDDEFAAQYARRRHEQLVRLQHVTESLVRLRGLGAEVDARRREFMSQRAKLHTTPLPQPEGFDAQGELRPSALYAARLDPPRYRLVDPAANSGRTIAYVDVPAALDLDMADFLGRVVGVRAGGKTAQQGGVSPVPIYIASELVVLRELTTNETTPGSNGGGSPP